MKYIKLTISLLAVMLGMMAFTSCEDVCEPEDFFRFWTKPSIGSDGDMTITVDSIYKSANIHINADGDWSKSVLYYWIDGTTDKLSKYSSSNSRNFSLSGLQLGTKYNVQYSLFDGKDNEVKSSIQSFTINGYVDMSVKVTTVDGYQAANVYVTSNSNWTKGVVHYWSEDMGKDEMTQTFTGSSCTLYKLQNNTKYYAYCVLFDSSNNSVKSATHEFTTGEYVAPHYLALSLEGDYNYDLKTGMFFEGNHYKFYPSNMGSYQITKADSIYVYQPCTNAAVNYSCTNVPVAAGSAFSWGRAYADYNNPKATVKMSVLPMCNVTFKFTNLSETSKSVTMNSVKLRNSSGSTHNPICYGGTFNMKTLALTRSDNHDAYYYCGTSLYMNEFESSKSIAFNYLLPTDYPTEAEIVCSFSDALADPVTFALPSSTAKTWTGGNSYTYNFTVKYTSKGVELKLTGVYVTPWTNGGSGDITIYQ